MSKKIHAVLLALLLTAFFAHSAFALKVKLEKVADGLTSPMGIRSANDGSGRLFIIEQTGKIKILKDGQVSPTPFLDISSKLVTLHQMFEERGLNGLAFHPNFKENGKFYVYYSYPITDDADWGLNVKFWYSHINRVAEFTASGDTTDLSTERKILDIPWPQFNHNGGDLAFGPDGMLYIPLGDGGFANDYGIGHNHHTGNGQDLSTLNGKILRIDINIKGKKTAYAIPKGNPFVKRNGARPEIWAYGFRNPYRVSFDMGGKRQLFVGDVQQDSYEEIDIARKGGNYGWRVMEASNCFNYQNPRSNKIKCNKRGKIMPIMEYNNCNKFPKNCRGLAVMGGYVYRGSHKKWQGYYFFGDWSRDFVKADGSIFVGRRSGKGWKMERVNITNMEGFSPYILGFGQDEKGEVYVMTTSTTGPTGSGDAVYKITP